MGKIKEIANRIWKDMKGAGWTGVVFLIYYGIVNSVFKAFCPLLVTTGIPCAGCGLTRATIFLIQGQLEKAAHINPSIFLIILFGLYCSCFRYIRGSKIRGFGVGVTLLITAMLLIYGYGMYHYFPNRVPYVYHENNILARHIPGYSDLIENFIQSILHWRTL